MKIAWYRNRRPDYANITDGDRPEPCGFEGIFIGRVIGECIPSTTIDLGSQCSWRYMHLLLKGTIGAAVTRYPTSLHTR
jgi:hypothetical protein